MRRSPRFCRSKPGGCRRAATRFLQKRSLKHTFFTIKEIPIVKGFYHVRTVLSISNRVFIQEPTICMHISGRCRAAGRKSPSVPSWRGAGRVQQLHTRKYIQSRLKHTARTDFHETEKRLRQPLPSPCVKSRSGPAFPAFCPKAGIGCKLLQTAIRAPRFSPAALEGLPNRSVHSGKRHFAAA